MDVKSVLKWGVIVVVVLVAWRALSGVLSGFSASSTTSIQAGSVPSLNPNYWMPGVYPYPSQAAYTGNPFYASPGAGGGSGKSRKMRPRPY
jgi:hypothetical protein